MRVSRQSASPPGSVRSLALMGAVLVVAFVSVTAFNKLMSGVPPGKVPGHLILWALLWSVAVLVFVPGILLAERAAISRGRARPYAVLVLVGSILVGTIVIPLLNWLGLPWDPWRIPGVRVPRQLLVSLDVAVRMGLAAFIYAAHRERLEAARTIQTLEARQNEIMGRLVASRLQAARARVQPELFIAELRAIRTACLEAPATAGAGLETLISRLRAASRGAAP